MIFTKAQYSTKVVTHAILNNKQINKQIAQYKKLNTAKLFKVRLSSSKSIFLICFNENP